MQTVDLPSTLIYARLDARPTLKDRVVEIARSIAEIGLINPIVVRPAKRSRNGAEADVWEILAGHHRYQACTVNLGMEVIPCVVRDADDDVHSELVMIDENLCRADLTPAQAAQQTARRKEIYEILHPETAHGAIGNGREKSRQFGDSTSDRFTADTASHTGRSERAVQRDAARGKALGEDLRRVSGTSLDKGIELDALAKLNPDEREDIVKRASNGERVSARAAVRLAPDPIDEAEVIERQVAAVMSAWNKAGEEARQRVRELIDEPVFDREVRP